MRNKTLTIIQVIAATLFTTVAQLLFKTTATTSGSVPSMLANVNFWGALFFYGLGFLFTSLGLKDRELSKFIPMLSLGFIWVLLFAIAFFGEQVTVLRVLGTFIIVAGISFLNMNEKPKRSVA